MTQDIPPVAQPATFRTLKRQAQRQHQRCRPGAADGSEAPTRSIDRFGAQVQTRVAVG